MPGRRHGAEDTSRTPLARETRASATGSRGSSSGRARDAAPCWGTSSAAARPRRSIACSPPFGLHAIQADARRRWSTMWSRCAAPTSARAADRATRAQDGGPVAIRGSRGVQRLSSGRRRVSRHPLRHPCRSPGLHHRDDLPASLAVADRQGSGARCGTPLLGVRPWIHGRNRRSKASPRGALARPRRTSGSAASCSASAIEARRPPPGGGHHRSPERWRCSRASARGGTKRVPRRGCRSRPIGDHFDLLERQ
jgi:hypothetical protein